ncbi:uncharacterized protein LOC131943835 isoform X2 [Physella acuta]|uniref:uncharacterized protein LOC131943835 isoform X2 n=1 Tax=Physella acuta TaxID=109671 RepID=UPI0027DC3CA3|nr:uncharacterized protein LOC131943835 isoform X2 [Physella acuta]
MLTICINKMNSSRLIVIVAFLQLQLKLNNTLTLGLQESQKDDGNKTCQDALIAEKDNFHFTGLVNFNSDQRLWNRFLTIQYKQMSNDEFISMCSFDTNTTVSTNSSNDCYCSNSSTNFKQFVINKTAKLKYSNAEIRAVMYSTNGKVVYSKTLKLPRIIKNFNSTLEADDKKYEISGCEKCNMTSSTIRFCCYSDDGSCIPVIYNNGEKVNNSAGNCTEFKLKANEIAYLAFSIEDSDTGIPAVNKSCIVEYTAREQKRTISKSLGFPFIIVGYVSGSILIVIAICVVVRLIRKKIKSYPPARKKVYSSKAFNLAACVRRLFKQEKSIFVSQTDI